MKGLLQLIIYIVVGFGLIIGIAKLLPESKGPQSKKSKEVFDKLDPDVQLIDWGMLRELDYRSGAMTETLRNLNGKRVRLPGYAVPLEDYQSKIKEFIFVPSPQACIHVPPPPPNQMIYVKMREPANISWNFRAVWVQGVLKISDVDSPYGKVSFELDGEKTIPYVPKEDQTY